MAKNPEFVKFDKVDKSYDGKVLVVKDLQLDIEEGEFEMMTDGTEERQFLYAEDCCEGLETVMEQYTYFKTEDPLHITSFRATSIKDIAEIIQGCFNRIGRDDVRIKPGLAKDSVQMDKRNEADTFISGWWLPKTGIDKGIQKVFDEMKTEYIEE